MKERGERKRLEETTEQEQETEKFEGKKKGKEKVKPHSRTRHCKYPPYQDQLALTKG